MEWTDEKIIALDFETSGTQPEYALQPWRVKTREAWPTVLSRTQHTGTRLVDEAWQDPDQRQLRRVLEEVLDRKQRVATWNGAFDIQWFIAMGLEKEAMRVSWLDGMLLWRHWFIEPEYDANPNQKKSYGLKACVETLLPHMAGYEEGIEFHNPDPIARAKLVRYAKRDTRFTWAFTKHWYQQLAVEPRRLNAALIEAQCLSLAAQANYDGMVIDTVATRELAQYLDDIAAKAIHVLAPHGVTEKIVRSPTQLATLLFDTWGLPVFKENEGKKTGKITRSTDKEVLHELSIEDERVAVVRVYRGALNNKTKFAKGPLESTQYNTCDQRTHPEARVFGTYSGRLTYSSKQGRGKAARQTGFAIHQEKRGEEFRGIVHPPPGYTLVEFDAAGQEFRWMAIASQDPTMLQLCEKGEDPHSYMGSRIAQMDYHHLINLVASGDKMAKNQRQLGKVGNLSLQYRTGARKLLTVARVQYGLPMRLPEAYAVRATYLQTYLKVPQYWKEQIALTRRRGWVETLAGRRVQVVGNWEGSLGWSMGSTSINYRIQGTGADQKYLAMAVLKPLLTKFAARFGWDLHDGIYLYVPTPKVDAFIAAARPALDYLPYQRAWGFTPPIPMQWDCKVGGSWGTLKERH